MESLDLKEKIKLQSHKEKVSSLILNTYQVYPNVALSNIIDHDLIKDKLNQLEKTFFFKSSIDFAVF